MGFGGYSSVRAEVTNDRSLIGAMQEGFEGEGQRFAPRTEPRYWLSGQRDR